jgi:hypothetical protein
MLTPSLPSTLYLQWRGQARGPELSSQRGPAPARDVLPPLAQPKHDVTTLVGMKSQPGPLTYPSDSWHTLRALPDMWHRTCRGGELAIQWWGAMGKWCVSLSILRYCRLGLILNSEQGGPPMLLKTRVCIRSSFAWSTEFILCLKWVSHPKPTRQHPSVNHRCSLGC